MAPVTYLRCSFDNISSLKIVIINLNILDLSAVTSWQYDHDTTVCPWPCGYGSSSWKLVCTNCRRRRAENRAHGWEIKTGWGEKQLVQWTSICYLQLTENGRRLTLHFSKIHSTLMLKSRIESKSGNNKNWKASPELFDGTIRSFGTDDRPSTELCLVKSINLKQGHLWDQA